MKKEWFGMSSNDNDVEKLKAENAQLKAHSQQLERDLAAALVGSTTLNLYRDNLMRYASHDKGCAQVGHSVGLTPPCSCGFSSAMGSEK